MSVWAENDSVQMAITGQDLEGDDLIILQQL